MAPVQRWVFISFPSLISYAFAVLLSCYRAVVSDKKRVRSYSAVLNFIKDCWASILSRTVGPVCPRSLIVLAKMLGGIAEFAMGRITGSDKSDFTQV